jgi:anti-anti-sigma factor
MISPAMSDHEAIEVYEQAGVSVVRPAQRLGMAEFNALADILDSLLRRDNPFIVIDCRDVSFIGSNAIGVLTAAKSEADRRNGRVVLGNLHDDIRRVMDQTGASTFISIVDDVDDLLRRTAGLVSGEPAPEGETAAAQQSERAALRAKLDSARLVLRQLQGMPIETELAGLRRRIAEARSILKEHFDGKAS